MNVNALKLSALVAVIAVLAAVLAVACGGGEPEELEIPVRVAGETMSPETIKAKQGDLVTLKIRSDGDGEFHLHTYDIEKDVAAEEVTDFFFVAEATGRFRITFHPSEEGESEHGEEEGEHGDEEEVDIGFLQVDPR